MSSVQGSETQVVLPLPPHGSPVPSRGSHRSTADEMSVSSTSAVSTNQRHYYGYFQSEKSLDDLTVSSYESSEASMSLFMEQIVDLKLGDEMSMSTRSCSSMQVSSIASPASLKSSRKNLLPPSNRPRTNTTDSSITGYLTMDSKSVNGGEDVTQSQEPLPHLETAVLDEAIGWSYSVDDIELNPPESNVINTATATSVKLPTAYVVVSGQPTLAHTNGHPTAFRRDRSVSPLPPTRSKSAPQASASVPQEDLDVKPAARPVPEEIRMRADLVWDRRRGSQVASEPTTRFSPSKSNRIYISYAQLEDDDVLCGRDERGSPHKGNARYRNIVAAKRSSYQAIASGERQKKTNMSTHIVEMIVKGRFLVKQDMETYYLMTKEEARKKVSQSLREK